MGQNEQSRRGFPFPFPTDALHFVKHVLAEHQTSGDQREPVIYWELWKRGETACAVKSSPGISSMETSAGPVAGLLASSQFLAGLFLEPFLTIFRLLSGDSFVANSVESVSALLLLQFFLFP